ncbi:MAG: DUF1761 domain-containing protein [Patescibacteria group bacterium]
MLTNVNILPVVVAALLHMIIGSLWYSQRFFGKPWMKLMGIKCDTEEDMAVLKKESKGMGKMYALAFVGSLLMAYTLSSLISLTRMRTIVEIMELAFWCWLGFVAVTTFANKLFTKKPLKLWAIDYGYPLVSLILMAILFTFWR